MNSPLFNPDLVDCGLSCRLEWIGISSNFFNFEVYTPAVLVIFAAWVIRRTWIKRKKKP